MPAWFFLILGVLAGVIIDVYERERSHKLKIGYQKWVAYHEAGHAVIAIYHGLRCLEVMLNVDQRGIQIHQQVKAHGYALIHTGPFRPHLELIYKSSLITFNTDALPRDPKVISFAKRHLEVLYAGDLVLHKLFDVPAKQLSIIDVNVSTPGDDLNSIQNIREYLHKIGEPVTEKEAMEAVGVIIDTHKEVRAAIHFLADKMLKYPGMRIPEAEIIADLKDCKFFDVYKKALGE